MEGWPTQKQVGSCLGGSWRQYRWELCFGMSRSSSEEGAGERKDSDSSGRKSRHIGMMWHIQVAVHQLISLECRICVYIGGRNWGWRTRWEQVSERLCKGFEVYSAGKEEFWLCWIWGTSAMVRVILKEEELPVLFVSFCMTLLGSTSL